ncbi:SWIM zinc finger domain-containing protein [Paenibacillus sp. S150]|uniref:SWIM zinc finger family protein n=1 Tax=Paenibacillus sp. S150 TaxID=2749826 RepID=UPI001E58E7F4|nr:SWIM zinc finger family protein [Paenibacillus sp. S150]
MKRGEDYLLSGHVESVRELKPGLYRAKVAGTEIYEVQVQIGEQDKVLSTSCTCPYNMEAICKHQAAVLMYLSDHLEENASADSNESAPASSLQQILEAKDKSELVSLLLSLALSSEQTEQRIRIYLSDIHDSGGIQDYRDLIRSYIDLHADRHGFVGWGKVNGAVQGAELVAARAVQAFEEDEPLQAVLINLCILEEMLKLLQEADDSDGTVGGMIDDSLDRIYEVAQLGEQLPPEVAEKLFHLVLGMTQHPELDGWPDWQLALLQCADGLAVSTELQARWEEQAGQLSQSSDSSSWSNQHFAAGIADIRLERLQRQDSGDELQVYLHNNLQFPSFREQAILLALDAARYDEAIRLAVEGEELDTANHLPGLVEQWKQLRYEAYKLSGDTLSQRDLGLELLCGGELSYYPAVKSAYSAAEWPSIYTVILDRLEQHSSWDNVYTKLLIQEQETDRLLRYVQAHPYEIGKYYPHLVADHPQEVIGIFRTYIEQLAIQASTRKQYRQVCLSIQMLRKASGSAAAEPVAHALLAAYPNRPAFKDELTRLLESF